MPFRSCWRKWLLQRSTQLRRSASVVAGHQVGGTYLSHNTIYKYHPLLATIDQQKFYLSSPRVYVLNVRVNIYSPKNIQGYSLHVTRVTPTSPFNCNGWTTDAIRHWPMWIQVAESDLDGSGKSLLGWWTKNVDLMSGMLGQTNRFPNISVEKFCVSVWPDLLCWRPIWDVVSR